MVGMLLLISAGFGAYEHKEPFDYPNGSEGAPAWFAETVAWAVRDGALVFEGGRRSCAILEQAPHGNDLSMEASAVIRSRQGTDWAAAGVTIRRDNDNYWHLALIEAPDAKGRTHHIELTEMLDGVWGSESAPATRLTPITYEGTGFPWEYGRPYRLRITMTPEQIEGFVLEADGTQRAHIAYRLDNRAVTSGQPALQASNFIAAFDDTAARVNQTVPSPEVKKAALPPYAAPGNPAIRARATGFFYPKEIEGRWWLVAPNGQTFYMVGTDHVNYRAHWCEKLGYAPYSRNVEAKYGSEKRWAEATAQRLSAWNFNTLPAGHSPSLRHRRFAHIEFLSFGSSFSDIDDLCPKTTWTGFPNVFSAHWARHCDKLARQECGPVKDDPWLIGYFLDNELEWFGKSYRPWGLFAEAWKKPADHSAKHAWIAFLKKELKSPAEFNQDWGASVADFEALASSTTPSPPRSARARSTAERWVRLVAEQYFKTCAEAIRRHDPNHLILGCRFAGDAPDVWDVAGKYSDVVSFNMYPRIDVDRGVPASVVKQIEGWRRKAGKPMMITEWSFPALDTDRPSIHGAGMRVDTQAQRAQCYRHFQTLMFRLPFMVGSSYFMWVDEPALGIAETFPEDSNYGLVNEQDEPYPDLTEAARDLNGKVYAVHAKDRVPAPMKPARPVSWLLKAPRGTLSVPGGAHKLTTGALRLEGPVGGHAWRLWRGETLLGDWFPLMHQETGQSLWVASDTARIIGMRQDARVTVVDMELSRSEPGKAITRIEEKSGRADAQTDAPRRFSSGWRFRVPRDAGAWFAAQCLWVENTDTEPWKLAEVFQYLVPALGGDPAGDEPLVGKAPNYYRRGAAWVDAGAGVGVGCWYIDEDAFQCSYWKDPGGGFHADLHETVDAELKPRQQVRLKGHLAFVFPLEDISTAGFGKAIARLEEIVTDPR